MAPLREHDQSPIPTVLGAYPAPFPSHVGSARGDGDLWPRADGDEQRDVPPLASVPGWGDRSPQAGLGDRSAAGSHEGVPGIGRARRLGRIEGPRHRAGSAATVEIPVDICFRARRGADQQRRRASGSQGRPVAQEFIWSQQRCRMSLRGTDADSDRNR